MNARISRFDYRPEYHALRREILEAIEQVLESGSLILGPRVEAFEHAMAEYLAGGYAVGVGSGTDAIALALRALKISDGDEVITVANSAVATVSAIRMAGATPVFCEIDPSTLMMDPQDARRRINPRTRAIVPVHLFGNAAEMREITRMASLYGLYVIEDCAQSLGTLLDGRQTGTWGDIGCFSFYPTKNLGAYGDGGMCVTRNRELADTIRQLRNYGCTGGSAAACEGVNSRLDELQAAILEVKLRHLPEHLHDRRRIATTYGARLPSECRVPSVVAGCEPTHHLFVIQTDHRQRLKSGLADAGIECGVHYPVPIHLMEAYRHLGYQRGSLPNTERAADRVLSLPCYPGLPNDAIEQVCSVIRAALTRAPQYARSNHVS